MWKLSVKDSHFLTLKKCLMLQHSLQSQPSVVGKCCNADHVVTEKCYNTCSHIDSRILRLYRDGKVNEAMHLFDEIPNKDVVTWTKFITGILDCGLIKEARQLFDRGDAVRNVVTWTAMMGSYLRLNQVREAENLFKDMPEKNVVSWNRMIEGYIRILEVDKALGLFYEMPERNVVSWNVMLSGLMGCGRVEEAQRLFDEMCGKNVISWTTMVAGLAKNGEIDRARKIFDAMPTRNVVSWNAMINAYAKSKRLDEAFRLFERIPERDVSSWNVMITAYVQNRSLDRARNLFNEMPRKNVVSWTAMMNGYAHEGESEDALRLFVSMIIVGDALPNEGTFVCVLGACSDLAAITEGQQVHQLIHKTGYQERRFIISSLVHMYSKCGQLTAAKMIFDGCEIIKRDLVIWNAIISAYANHGCAKEAINMFEEMKDKGVNPNDVSYLGLLSACSHSGLIELGLEYFGNLIKDDSIQIREEHVTCLVDLCGRAGKLKEVNDLLDHIKIKPLSSIWDSFIACCNIHGNMELGKQAEMNLSTKSAISRKNAGMYLSLSNMYASSDKWGEASRIRSKMKNLDFKKQPGCSWIEIENRVHVFVVHDFSHPQSDLTFSVINDLHRKMKLPSCRQYADVMAY